jgi:hypothetical protein
LLIPAGNGAGAADPAESLQKRVGIHGENQRPSVPSDSLHEDYAATSGLYSLKRSPSLAALKQLLFVRLDRLQQLLFFPSIR